MIKTSRYRSNLRASYQKSLRITGLCNIYHCRIWLDRVVIIWVSKSTDFSLLRCVIGLDKNSRHFVVQSELSPNVIQALTDAKFFFFIISAFHFTFRFNCNLAYPLKIWVTARGREFFEFGKKGGDWSLNTNTLNELTRRSQKVMNYRKMHLRQEVNRYWITNILRWRRNLITVQAYKIPYQIRLCNMKFSPL